MSVPALPADVWYLIVQYCDFSTFMRLRGVDRQLRHICTKPYQRAVAHLRSLPLSPYIFKTAYYQMYLSHAPGGLFGPVRETMPHLGAVRFGFLGSKWICVRGPYSTGRSRYLDTYCVRIEGASLAELVPKLSARELAILGQVLDAERGVTMANIVAPSPSRWTWCSLI